MTDQQWLAERFGQHRRRLRAVAYRMLGSFTEAEDAVQETWMRLTRANSADIESLDAWLTTAVARVSLNMLRARQSRHEQAVGVHIPDPIVTSEGALGPEEEAMLADSVGMAMLIVLETLAPAERLAFVLHDMFAVRFDEIAPIVGRSPTAARQLASRARRQLQASNPVSDTDLASQRQLVDAFLAAAREGDFDKLIEVLDPEVVLRSDVGLFGTGGSRVVQGARAVAKRARAFSRPDRTFVAALVNGTAGLVSFERGRPTSACIANT